MQAKSLLNPLVIGCSEAEPDQPLINKPIYPDIRHKPHFQAYLPCPIIFSYGIFLPGKNTIRQHLKTPLRAGNCLMKCGPVFRRNVGSGISPKWVSHPSVIYGLSTILISSFVNSYNS